MSEELETVADIMSQPPLTVNLNQRVREVLLMLTKKGISGVPLVNDRGQLTGIISSMDIILAASIGKGESCLGELPLSISPVKEVVKLKADAPIKEAILAIVKKRLGRVVVIDDRMKPIGIVSRNDLLKYFYDNIL
jgi:CBS domain-containing protein